MVFDNNQGYGNTGFKPYMKKKSIKNYPHLSDQKRFKSSLKVSNIKIQDQGRASIPITLKPSSSLQQFQS